MTTMHDPPARGPLRRLYPSSYSRDIGHYVDLDVDGNTWRADPILDLDAPYQRGSVWTDAQRADLIRSLLIGLPVGAVVISTRPAGWRHDDRHRAYRVIDGKQRIEAVTAFVAGRVAVPAWWFEADPALTDAETVTYPALSRARRMSILRLPLPSVEVDLVAADRAIRTEDDLLAAEAEVYRLINSAGTAHTIEGRS